MADEVIYRDPAELPAYELPALLTVAGGTLLRCRKAPYHPCKAPGFWSRLWNRIDIKR